MAHGPADPADPYPPAIAHPAYPPAYPPPTGTFPATPPLLVYPPNPRYPLPAPRRRRWLVPVLAGGLALLVTAVVITAIMLDRGDPRWIRDTAAGISYVMPEGWQQGSAQGLFRPFTSYVAPASAMASRNPNRATATGEDATILAGSWQGLLEKAPTSAADLAEAAASLASGYGDFFFPQDGTGEWLFRRAITIDGRPAATAAIRIVFTSNTGRTAYVRVTIVLLASGGVAILLGVCKPDDPTTRKVIDDALDSIRVI